MNVLNWCFRVLPQRNKCLTCIMFQSGASMFRKILLLVLTFSGIGFRVNAQQDSTKLAGRVNPAFQHLVLELSASYFTVVKEAQVNLDSSLIHVSHSLSLSRLPIVAEGIDDNITLSNAQWVDRRDPATGQKQLTRAKGKTHAALSILLGAYFAFEPASEEKTLKLSNDYLTAGIKECARLNNVKLKLVGQRLLAKLYLKSEKFAEADKLFAAVKDGFIKAEDLHAAAITCAWWGLYAPVTATNPTLRIKHIEMAEQIFRSIGEKEGEISSLINDCYLHMLINDLGASERLAKEALRLTEEIHFPYAHYVTAALMSTTMFQGKFGEPLTYCIKSIERSETTKDNIALPYFYGVVAGLYGDEGNREDIAIDWEKKSVNLFLTQHEHGSIMGVHDLVDILLGRGRKAEALTYINLVNHQLSPKSKLDSLFYNLTLGSYNTYIHNWALAHQFLNKAILLEKEIELHGLNVRKPDVLMSLANLYFKEGDYKQAKINYEQYLSLQAIGNGGLKGGNALALEALLKIDSVSGDRKSELRDYKRFTEAIIRNYKVSKTMLAEELQVKYATADRISQINLLSQKAKLEQENLDQARLSNNVIVIAIILVIVIAGLLFRQSEIRKKNNVIVTRKNELMQKLLDEKEWLVKEIHHRVKNNLHTIICLLESQAAYLDNDALKAIENSQHRIYAMSLIHQKLYQSEDIKVINMNSYLTEFIKYLEDSFGSPENIKVILKAEDIKLGAGQAIPIGLIINEAVNNSFKYAFPNQRKGEINIVLKKIDNDIHLSVKDNGIGFKRKSDHEMNSLGLELIKGLTFDLRGDVKFDTENGTSISLRFKFDPLDVLANEDGLSVPIAYNQPK